MDTTSDGAPVKHLATFAVRAGPRINEEFPVSAPRVQIGSGNQNDLVIADDSISTNHALLEYEHGGWRLTDLDSTNGTHVEGVRLAPQVPTPLPFGSTVRFGGLQLHFRPVADADPEAARAAYEAPAPRPSLAERNTGFRLPLWALLLVILVAVVVAVGVFAWMEPGGETAPQTQGVEQTSPPPAPADQVP